MQTQQRQQPRHAHRGFTLVETVIALTLVATAFTALWLGLSDYVRNSRHLMQVVSADLVARNTLDAQHMASYRLSTIPKESRPAQINTGNVYEGKTFMGNMPLFVESKMTDTTVTGLYRYDVYVYNDPHEATRSLFTYIDRTKDMP